MRVTHRVKNSTGETVGFIVDNKTFYNKHFISMYAQEIDNITVTSSGVIRSKKGKLLEITLRQYNDKLFSELCKTNPFVRDIQTFLIDWKSSSNRHVLQLEGPRQVGKTTELLKFGYKHYEQVVYVNVANDTGGFLDKVVYAGINTLAMSAYCKSNNLPYYADNSSTLLLIDEIQASSTVYNSIRAFNSNLNCDIIVTGSYLGQLLNREFFQPAGTIRNLELGPLPVCQVLSSNGDKAAKELVDTLYNMYTEWKSNKQASPLYPEAIKVIEAINKGARTEFKLACSGRYNGVSDIYAYYMSGTELVLKLFKADSENNDYSIQMVSNTSTGASKDTGYIKISRDS